MQEQLNDRQTHLGAGRHSLTVDFGGGVLLVDLVHNGLDILIIELWQLQ